MLSQTSMAHVVPNRISLGDMASLDFQSTSVRSRNQQRYVNTCAMQSRR